MIGVEAQEAPTQRTDRTRSARADAAAADRAVPRHSVGAAPHPTIDRDVGQQAHVSTAGQATRLAQDEGRHQLGVNRRHDRFPRQPACELRLLRRGQPGDLLLLAAVEHLEVPRQHLVQRGFEQRVALRDDRDVPRLVSAERIGRQIGQIRADPARAAVATFDQQGLEVATDLALDPGERCADLVRRRAHDLAQRQFGQRAVRALAQVQAPRRGDAGQRRS